MSDRLVEIHINMQGRVIVRYDGGKCVDVTDTRGTKLYTAPPAAKVNQQLLEALDKLISVAEMCDSWESFPSKALDEARAAIAAAQEQSK